MRLDGTNFEGVQIGSMKQTAQVQQDSAKKEKLNADLQEGLNGSAAKKQAPSKQDTITPNERKELIKWYKECGYTTKEAKAMFDSKADELEKMSRKEAKNWCKNYMEENGCSKKEAKQAFKDQFGYSVPLNKYQKVLRTCLTFGGIGQAVDIATGGKLGIRKFVLGNGNNDAAYVKKDIQ